MNSPDTIYEYNKLIDFKQKNLLRIRDLLSSNNIDDLIKSVELQENINNRIKTISSIHKNKIQFQQEVNSIVQQFNPNAYESSKAFKNKFVPSVKVIQPHDDYSQKIINNDSYNNLDDYSYTDYSQYY